MRLQERVFANAISGLPRKRTRNKLPNYKAGPESERHEAVGCMTNPPGPATHPSTSDSRHAPLPGRAQQLPDAGLTDRFRVGLDGAVASGLRCDRIQYRFRYAGIA